VPIYLNTPHIRGSVTAKGFDGWVPVSSVNHECYRSMKPHAVGDGHHRDYSVVRVSHFELVKPTDISSASLYQHFFQASTLDTVKIALTTCQQQNAYLTYTLNHVIIAYLHRSFDEYQEHPTETLHLNYMSYEEQFVPYDSQNRMPTLHSVGYDVAAATTL
jgi:type VI protein secretion system component Hcp